MIRLTKTLYVLFLFWTKRTPIETSGVERFLEDIVTQGLCGGGSPEGQRDLIKGCVERRGFGLWSYPFSLTSGSLALSVFLVLGSSFVKPPQVLKGVSLVSTLILPSKTRVSTRIFEVPFIPFHSSDLSLESSTLVLLH